KNSEYTAVYPEYNRSIKRRLNLHLRAIKTPDYILPGIVMDRIAGKATLWQSEYGLRALPRFAPLCGIPSLACQYLEKDSPPNRGKAVIRQYAVRRYSLPSETVGPWKPRRPRGYLFP